MSLSRIIKIKNLFQESEYLEKITFSEYKEYLKNNNFLPHFSLLTNKNLPLDFVKSNLKEIINYHGFPRKQVTVHVPFSVYKDFILVVYLVNLEDFVFKQNPIPLKYYLDQEYFPGINRIIHPETNFKSVEKNIVELSDLMYNPHIPYLEIYDKIKNSEDLESKIEWIEVFKHRDYFPIEMIKDHFHKLSSDDLYYFWTKCPLIYTDIFPDEIKWLQISSNPNLTLEFVEANLNRLAIHLDAEIESVIYRTLLGVEKSNSLDRILYLNDKIRIFEIYEDDF